MAKFKFSLDSLKRFREQKLQLAKKELAVVENLWNDKNGEALRMARARFEEAENDSSAALQLAGLVTEMSLRRQKMLEAELQKIGQDVERHRAWVVHLGRELKAVEKLEEKRRAQWSLEQATQEKRRADSWVAENWGRRGGLEES